VPVPLVFQLILLILEYVSNTALNVKYSPRIGYSVISIPFLLLFFYEFAFGFPQLIKSDELIKNYRLATDVLFLNSLHIVFSFFLVYRIKDFRAVWGDNKLTGWLYSLIPLGFFSYFLMRSSWNHTVFMAISQLHVVFQSIGLFMLYFASRKHHQILKKIGWLCVLLMFALKMEYLKIDIGLQYFIGVVLMGIFSTLSRSFWGFIFSIRFFLWLVPLSLSSLSQAAIHGLEYFLVIYYIFESAKVKFTISDVVLMLALLAIPSAFVITQQLNITNQYVLLLFTIGLYYHYIFDSIAFRFSLPIQKNLKLRYFPR
jgi:hypothetical protein